MIDHDEFAGALAGSRRNPSCSSRAVKMFGPRGTSEGSPERREYKLLFIAKPLMFKSQNMLNSIWNDLIHAARALAKARAFTFVCVVSLGIGMAPVIAIPYFSRLLTIQPAGVKTEGLVEIITTRVGSREATEVGPIRTTSICATPIPEWRSWAGRTDKAKSKSAP